MGKKTDYKRLWRNAKGRITDLQNSNFQLVQIAEQRGEIIEDIKSGKIKLEDINKELVSKHDFELLKKEINK